MPHGHLPTKVKTSVRPIVPGSQKMSQRNLAGALRLRDGSAILSSTYAPTNSIHKTAIRMAGFVDPRNSSAAAFSLFCTPPKVLSKGSAERRLEEKLAPLFLSADARRVVTSGAAAQAYMWRGDLMTTNGLGHRRII